MDKEMTRRAPTLIVSLIFLLAAPHSARCAEFKADLVRSSGGDSDASKVYMKGDLRREDTYEDGELSAVTIFRPDKGVTWNLMPEEEMYMEVPLVEGMDGTEANIDKLESSANVEILGEETINGFVCEKRRYGGSDETPGEVVVWYSTELDYPVKLHLTFYEGEDELVLEYQNIDADEVPDSIFEIPEGYEKFAVPGMPEGFAPGEMPPGMPSTER
jgi:hypothetical protein